MSLEVLISDNFLKKAALQKRLSFLSPAKINLFFRILYKRDDGYHEIASLYQAISLHDTLIVELASEDLWTCSDRDLPLDRSNLVIKALELFRRETGIHAPLKIHLEKKIPMQAGLGGGSSNTATALWAFTQLFSVDWSLEKLASLGSKIGADVPFFFSCGSSYCTGYGEKLENISLPDFLQGRKLWIAKPNIGVSTQSVYSSCNPKVLSPRDPQKSLEQFMQGKGSFYNDLEVVAFSLNPFLEKLKITLQQSGFDEVLLSGSGSSFFCIGKILPPPIEGVEFFQADVVHKANTSRWYQL